MSKNLVFPIEFTFRSAVKSDIPRIQELLRETGLYFEPIDSRPDVYEKQLDHDPDSIVVAEHHNRIIGMQMFVYSPLYSVVFHLAVEPKYQRLTLGTAIFTRVIGRIRQRGCCDIAGYVEENNKASHGLCNRLGLKKYPTKLIARYMSFPDC